MSGSECRQRTVAGSVEVGFVIWVYYEKKIGSNNLNLNFKGLHQNKPYLKLHTTGFFYFFYVSY